MGELSNIGVHLVVYTEQSDQPFRVMHVLEHGLVKIPGGGLQQPETPHQCLCRELKEELYLIMDDEASRDLSKIVRALASVGTVFRVHKYFRSDTTLKGFSIKTVDYDHFEFDYNKTDTTQSLVICVQDYKWRKCRMWNQGYNSAFSETYSEPEQFVWYHRDLLKILQAYLMMIRYRR